MSNLFYCPAIIVRMLAIIATVPRLTPTTIHRILLGIDRSFKTCQILFFSRVTGAVLFCQLSHHISHCNPCAVDFIFCGHCMYSKIALCCQANTPCPFYNSQESVLDRVNVSVVYHLIGKLKVWYTFSFRCTFTAHTIKFHENKISV